jgi:hypothetical protein
MGPRELNWEEVTFSVECLPEDAPIKGNVMDSGDPDADAREEERIYNAYQTNEWAWCCVRVVATWGEFEGDAYLGCCSYESEEDFKQGGYYDDLANEALSALDQRIAATFESIRPLLEICPS